MSIATHWARFWDRIFEPADVRAWRITGNAPATGAQSRRRVTQAQLAEMLAAGGRVEPGEYVVVEDERGERET